MISSTERIICWISRAVKVIVLLKRVHKSTTARKRASVLKRKKNHETKNCTVTMVVFSKRPIGSGTRAGKVAFAKIQNEICAQRRYLGGREALGETTGATFFVRKSHSPKSINCLMDNDDGLNCEQKSIILSMFLASLQLMSLILRTVVRDYPDGETVARGDSRRAVLHLVIVFGENNKPNSANQRYS